MIFTMKTKIHIPAVLSGLLFIWLSTLALAAQGNADWAGTYRYAEANAQMTSSPKAVLFGDSITEGWASNDPVFFKENNFVGRGIGGQTTSQILVRMRNDVIDIHPEYVVIQAGINDIALNDGHAIDIESAVGSIKSMCEIALANGIEPIVCSLLCSTRFYWRPEVTDAYEQIQRFNSLLKDYATANHIKYVDYFQLLAGSDGRILPEYSTDTVHPTLQGYKKMEEYLLTFIER